MGMVELLINRQRLTLRLFRQQILLSFLQSPDLKNFNQNPEDSLFLMVGKIVPILNGQMKQLTFVRAAC